MHLCMGEGSSPCLAAPSFSELIASGRHLRFAAFLSGSPRHNHSSAFARTEVYLHEGRAFRCLPLNGFRRPPYAALLLPCGSACSRRTTASPAPRPTFLHPTGRGLSSLSGDIAMRCTPPPCTSMLCTSLPCTVTPPSPVVGPALAPALPNHSRARPNRVRPWPAPHLLRPPFFCSHTATLRLQLRLRLRRVPALLAARAFTLLRRHQPRLPALLLHRARAAPPARLGHSARHCSLRTRSSALALAYPLLLCRLPVAQRSRATQAAPTPAEPLARAPPTAPPAPSAPASRPACASSPGRLCLLRAARPPRAPLLHCAARLL
jgi:hypothetical protein